MSVVVEGLLLQKLPDTAWRLLVVNFGYCTGFLIVVLGRLQLFTENTITAVLPLLLRPSCRNFVLVARLWAIVFAANLVGTLIFAFAARYFGIFTAEPIARLLLLAQSEHLFALRRMSAFGRQIQLFSATPSNLSR